MPLELQREEELAGFQGRGKRRHGTAWTAKDMGGAAKG